MGTAMAIFAIILFVAAIVCFVLFVVKTIKVKGKRIKKSRRRAIKRLLFASGLFLLSSIIATAIGMRLFPAAPENLATSTETGDQVNVYGTESLLEKDLFDLTYSIPLSWEEDSATEGNNTYYYDDGLMIMIQWQDFDWYSFDDFDSDEKELMIESLIEPLSEGLNGYEEVESGYTDFCGTSTIRIVANIDVSGYSYFEALFFANNYKSYTIELTSESENEEVNKEIFESFLGTVKIGDNTNSYSAESSGSNDEIINQLKELYMGQAQEDLPYSEDDSLSYLEVVLKTSKELANSSSDPEELVDNALFNSYALSAGYLCNYYDDDVEYGKVGNMAFELMGYIVTEDQENKDRILSEFDEIAAEYGWTIVTLEDSEEQNDTGNETVSESENKSEENDEATITIGQRNALNSAKSYLDIMAFSYTGLIEQLEYEGYTAEEATYAADNCGADWNEQAAKSAKNYLDIMSFSRDGLIEQLEYEGFTHEQAVYGVEQNGY